MDSRSPQGRTAAWAPRVLALFGLGLFAFVVRRADPHATARVLIAAGPWLALALLPFGLQMSLSAAAWRALLGLLGRPVAWTRLLLVSLAAEAMLMSVPGGTALAETLKPWLLRREPGVPVGVTVASIAAKKTLLAFAQALYLALALLSGASLLARLSRPILGRDGLLLLVLLAAALMAGVGVVLAVTFGSGLLAERVRGLLSAIPFEPLRRGLARRRALFTEADSALARVGSVPRRQLVGALLLLAAAWLVEAAETWLILLLLGAPTSPVAALVTEASVVMLRNLAFFVPSGLGVQDAGYLAFFAALGVPAPAGTAFIVAKRAKELLWIGAGYLLLLLARFGSDRPSDGAVAMEMQTG